MTRHTHDDGQLLERHVDYDHVVHHRDSEAGLLTVTGVPVSACDVCDEYWFSDAVGFALAGLLQEHGDTVDRMASGSRRLKTSRASRPAVPPPGGRHEPVEFRRTASVM